MDTLTTTDSAARTLLGIGLYTVTEAASLTGIPALRIRRWLGRYAHGPRDAQSRSDPLWTPQLPRIGQDVALGFRDLMELRFVARFVAAGISLHGIRRGLAIGRQMVGDERPFSTTRFRTDGRTIFLQVSNEVGEPALLDLLNRQYAFHRVVEPSFRDIDFGEGAAERWWPMSHRSRVVVDPTRNFGHPIVAEPGGADTGHRGCRGGGGIGRQGGKDVRPASGRRARRGFFRTPIQLLVASDGDLVVALRHRFPADTPDEVWISALGTEGGWSVLSGDVRITRRPTEKLAWHRSRLKGFFLAPAWSKLSNLERRPVCCSGGRSFGTKSAW